MITADLDQVTGALLFESDTGLADLNLIVKRDGHHDGIEQMVSIRASSNYT
jgi:hypothetical protein